jgi:lantibiotic biosynthesis protein
VNPRWKPILDGELAKKAEATVSRIAITLARAYRSLSTAKPHWNGGAPAEFALFFGCLGAATGQAEYRRQSERLVELAAESFRASAGLGLHGGLCGLAWIIQFLARPPVSLGLDPEGVCAPADELLLDRLLELQDSRTWTDYDLISGLAGQGIYLLKRLPSRKAERALKLIIRRLEATAKQMPDGIAWHTPARTLPEHQRKIAPRGYYNLGLAHGVPGLIGFLGEAYHRRIEQKRALTLLEGAVAWVRSQKLRANLLSILPAWVAPGRPPAPCRVAWCYGDLGAAAALLHAARRAGRGDWEAEALAMGHQAASCAFRRSGVVDACLCHGAAGNGHLFHRLFRATGDEIFLAAARSHFAQALRLRGSGQKLAGYSFWTNSGSSPLAAWGPDASLLSGITGLGLALLSATHPFAPGGWDGLLLPDSPASAAVDRKPPPRSARRRQGPPG